MLIRQKASAALPLLFCATRKKHVSRFVAIDQQFEDWHVARLGLEHIYGEPRKSLFVILAEDSVGSSQSSWRAFHSNQVDRLKFGPHSAEFP